MTASASSLHVLLCTIGSAGDVNPFIGLGRELKRRGHRVTLITCGYFADSIRRAGLELSETVTREQYLELIGHPDLWNGLKAPQFVMSRAVAPQIRTIYERIRELNEPGRTVVAASTLSLGARVAEEKLGIPTAAVHLQPAVVRSFIEPPVLAGMLCGPRVPEWLLKLQYWVADRVVLDRLLGPELNGLRSELGLAPVKRIFRDYLHSPRCTLGMFPDWFAPPQADWPKSVRLTGFPLYDESDVTSLEDGLSAFLASGEPPIAFTAGSAMQHGERFFAAAVDGCVRFGRRGLLISRYAEQLPKSLPPEVRHVPFAPFTHLLPRCAALVHHGGIGTMSQALAAGIPQLVVPLAHDQFDNGARAERLGVGRRIARRRFDAGAGAAEIEALLRSPSVAEACRRYAAKLAGFNPLAATADAVEALVAKRYLFRPVRYTHSKKKRRSICMPGNAFTTEHTEFPEEEIRIILTTDNTDGTDE